MTADETFSITVTALVLLVIVLGRTAPERFRLFSWVAGTNDEMAVHPFSRRSLRAKFLTALMIGLPSLAIIVFVMRYFPQLLDR